MQQSVLEAANHIAQEIEKTRQHLANLEQALQGLQPLITVEAASNALTYSEQVLMATIEDASIVAPVRKKKLATKPKGKKPSKPASKSPGIPATGAELWLKSLGHKKLTLDQICEATLESLKLGGDAKATIRNRAGAWLHAAVKKGQVSAAVNRAGVKVFHVTKS